MAAAQQAMGRRCGLSATSGLRGTVRGLLARPTAPQRPPGAGSRRGSRSSKPPRALPAAELADALDAALAAAPLLHAQPLLDVSDAAAAAAAAADNADTSMFAPLTNGLEAVLKAIQGVLVRANVPYSYGFSIILLTVLVKILTYPLTKKQVRTGFH